MAKKLLLIVAAIALLLAGAFAGIKYAGDNRGTTVGDAARYSAVTKAGALTQSVGGSGTGTVHEVRDGDSIQAAVAAAQSGDVIKIYPGTYHETVYIDKDDIVISGVIIDGAWPDMEAKRSSMMPCCIRATTSRSRTCRSSTSRAMRSWDRPATTS